MAGVFLGMIVSTVGIGYFVYGKKEADAAFMLSGLALATIPYFVTGMKTELAIAAALLYLPFAVGRYLD